MWKFKNILNENPPMTEILHDCSNKSNLRLVIYHLGENHVECATERDGLKYNLSSDVANSISNYARAKHAILAYDIKTNAVYLVDSAPELNACSAILLCVLTEIMNSSSSNCSYKSSDGIGRNLVHGEPDSYEFEAECDDALDDDDDGSSNGFDFEPNVGYKPMIGIGNLGFAL